MSKRLFLKNLGKLKEDKEVRAKRKELMEMQKLAKKFNSEVFREDAKRIYEELKKIKIRKDKGSWDNFREEMNEEEITEFIKKLGKIYKAKNNGPNTTVVNIEMLNSAAEHYKNQLKPCILKDGSRMPQQVDNTYNELFEGDPLEAPIGNLLEYIKVGRIRNIMKLSGDNKSPGSDNLVKELFPVDEEQPYICVFLSLFFELIIKWGVTPMNWSEGILVPIYKKKGVKEEWANWRPITLLSFFRKIFESCFKEAIIGNGFHFYQGGFKKKRSTLDQVAALNEAIRKYKKKFKNTCVAFLDIWAAYDTVDRTILWKKCRERNINERLIRILAGMARNNTNRVSINNFLSKEVYFRAGVQQGGTISPHLYNVFINGLCERIESSGIGIKSESGKPICSFLFADDVALIAKDDRDLQELLNVCEEYSREMLFRWKPSKCEVLSKNNNQLTIYGEVLVNAQEFVYLGVPFNINGICVDSMLKRSF
jgi:Reverse transcriptase (RNA-dependent DNA polymerase)